MGLIPPRTELFPRHAPNLDEVNHNPVCDCYSPSRAVRRNKDCQRGSRRIFRIEWLPRWWQRLAIFTARNMGLEHLPYKAFDPPICCADSGIDHWLGFGLSGQPYLQSRQRIYHAIWHWPCHNGLLPRAFPMDSICWESPFPRKLSCPLCGNECIALESCKRILVLSNFPHVMSNSVETTAYSTARSVVLTSSCYVILCWQRNCCTLSYLVDGRRYWPNSKDGSHR